MLDLCILSYIFVFLCAGPPEQPRRLEPLRTCTGPLRVGLSKRAKTKHLHRPHPYKWTSEMEWRWCAWMLIKLLKAFFVATFNNWNVIFWFTVYRSCFSCGFCEWFWFLDILAAPLSREGVLSHLHICTHPVTGVSHIISLLLFAHWVAQLQQLSKCLAEGHPDSMMKENLLALLKKIFWFLKHFPYIYVFIYPFIYSLISSKMHTLLLVLVGVLHIIGP